MVAYELPFDHVATQWRTDERDAPMVTPVKAKTHLLPRGSQASTFAAAVAAAAAQAASEAKVTTEGVTSTASFTTPRRMQPTPVRGTRWAADYIAAAHEMASLRPPRESIAAANDTASLRPPRESTPVRHSSSRLPVGSAPRYRHSDAGHGNGAMYTTPRTQSYPSYCSVGSHQPQPLGSQTSTGSQISIGLERMQSLSLASGASSTSGTPRFTSAPVPEPAARYPTRSSNPQRSLSRPSSGGPTRAVRSYEAFVPNLSYAYGAHGQHPGVKRRSSMPETAPTDVATIIAAASNLYRLPASSSKSETFAPRTVVTSEGAFGDWLVPQAAPSRSTTPNRVTHGGSARAAAARAWEDAVLMSPAIGTARQVSPVRQSSTQRFQSPGRDPRLRSSSSGASISYHPARASIPQQPPKSCDAAENATFDEQFAILNGQLVRIVHRSVSPRRLSRSNSICPGTGSFSAAVVAPSQAVAASHVPLQAQRSVSAPSSNGVSKETAAQIPSSPLMSLDEQSPIRMTPYHQDACSPTTPMNLQSQASMTTATPLTILQTPQCPPSTMHGTQRSPMEIETFEVEHLHFCGGVFDPTVEPLKSQVLSRLVSLGVDADCEIEVLDNAGGLNDGMWSLEGSSRQGPLVLKLVKKERRHPMLPTDVENFMEIIQGRPTIINDHALSFPIKMFHCIGDDEEWSWDLIIMRKAPGRGFEAVVATKCALGQIDSLMQDFDKLGSFLAQIHTVYGMQHGDLQPSNVYYDDASGWFSLVDCGSMGPNPYADDDDLQHLRAGVRLITPTMSQDFQNGVAESLEAGYLREIDQRRQRRDSDGAN